jgi:hypothetical protein
VNGHAASAKSKTAPMKISLLKIARHFSAGTTATNIFRVPSDGRRFLSSLTGLMMLPDREPSHKWLGYFQRLNWAKVPQLEFLGEVANILYILEFL